MKALNVFAIIAAWILSIALVLMLIGAPLTLSALSLLSPENIVELIGDALIMDNDSAAAQPQIMVQNLSAEVEVETEEAPTTGNVAGGMDLSGIQEILGGEVMFNKLMESPAMAELLSAYLTDVTNAIAGKDADKAFTAELLAEVVEENIDEIVEIVAAGSSITDEEKEQLKQQIQTGVVEKADEIVAELPSAEEIKESVLEGDEGLAIVFEILAMRNQIKGVIVGVIVVIAALIFALRFPGFRGLRWLSIDLLIASLFNGMICKALGASSGDPMGLFNSLGSEAEGVAGMLLSQLAKGVVVRTVVMFVVAALLMVGYILLKKFMKKKVVAAPAEEAFVPEAVPAFVPAPVAVETEQVAETVQAEEPAAEKAVAEPAPVEEI